ncbi:MAG: hypothetical protein U1F43_03105 [Myxococcota bacterium]
MNDHVARVRASMSARRLLQAAVAIVAAQAGACFPGPLGGDASGDTSPSDATAVDDTSAVDSATLDVGLGRECESSADCDDHDACTGIETCGADGRCRSGSAVECALSSDACRDNVCQPATGDCQLVAAHETDACDDGKLCTHDDACAGGVCKGVALVWNDGLACTVDRCVEGAAVCVFDDAACQCETNADCDNHDACDGVETCGAARTCQKGTAVVCEASTVACLRNACQPGTGACELVDDDGAACDDGDPCTDSDGCLGGECLSATKDCADAAACTSDACDGDTGGCTHVPDGSCECLVDGDCPDDGNACNGSMTCAAKSLTCVLGAPPGDGAACDDGQKCTGPDACQGTTCTGAPTTCSASSDPCQVNACDPASGQCKLHAADDDTPCDDADACTQSDVCAGGHCVGSDPVECQPLSDCHKVGNCDAATGLCSSPTKPAGTLCDAAGDPGFCTNGDCRLRMLSADGWHNCIVLNGNVRCWGRNDSGVLGYAGVDIGDDEPASIAPLVDFTEDVIDLSTSTGTTCVVLAGGSARCWGYGALGALGNGSLDNQTDPLTAPAVTISGNIRRIRTGGLATCALRTDGQLWCFGDNVVSSLGYPDEEVVADPGTMPPVGLGTDLPILDVSVYDQVCVVFDVSSRPDVEGNLKCWGYNYGGQTGYGTRTNIADPASVGFVPVGGTVVAVQAGAGRTCALLEGGLLKCWGGNQYGELGLGTVGQGDDLWLTSPSPDPIALGGPVVAFALGGNHACAREQSGIVRCWGKGIAALGLEVSENVSAPLQVNPATGVEVGGRVVQLVAGFDHTCALMDTAAVRCWGSGATGVLGYGTVQDYGGVAGSMPPPNVPYQ